MKNIGINTPCSENWNEMSKNDKGAFCQKCASQVYDFTKKSSLEIKQTLLSLVGQPVCGRITQSQEDSLNLEFETWMNRKSRHSFQSLLIFSLIVVFGMTLFSCENEQDSNKIKNLQTEVARIIEQDKDSIKIIPQEKKSVNDELEIVEQIQIMGEMTFIEQKEQKLIEEYDVLNKRIDYDRGYAGGMSISRNYEIFLIEEINNVPIDVYDENGNLLPKNFEILAFPNPAKEKTTLEIALPTKSVFEINLFDMNGKMLKSIYSGEIDKGKFRQEIDLIDLNSGIYLIVINSKDFQKTVRISKI
ncbi:MAG: T9SS type A sorting domain-containing protein [Bacteroidota bacterium]